MLEKLRQFALFVKAFLFTVTFHAILFALLFFSFSWVKEVDRGNADADAIQAVVVSEQKYLEQKRKKREQKLAEEERAQRKLEQKRAQKLAEEKRAQRKLEQKRAQKLAEEERAQRELEQKRDQKLAEEERIQRELAEKLAEEERAQRELEEKLAEEERAQRELAEKLAKEERIHLEQNANDAFRRLFDQITEAVEQHWIRPPQSSSGLTAVIRVKVDRGGRVTSVRVIESSGDPYFDRSTEVAVQKASPLPFPSNPKYYKFINKFNFKFDPNEL